MPNLVDLLLDVAEGDVGRHEEPWGSNRGPWLDPNVQRPYGDWMLRSPGNPNKGQPWCNAYRGRLLRAVGVARWAFYASPSTQITADRARAGGYLCKPQPGAAICWPGHHIETLVSLVAGTLWNCIGGNASDQVKQTVRNVADAGCIIFLEPELAASVAANPTGRPAVEFYFHDTKPEIAKHGGFATKALRDAVIAKLSADWQARASRWHNANGYGFTVGPKVLYGPFRSQTKRNAARERVAALYHDPVKDFAAFRLERRPSGLVTVPAVPDAIRRRLGLTAGAQPDAMGKTT